MAVTSAASGTQTATVTTEHTLAALETAGVYVFEVDTVNMVAGDVLELRIKKMTLTGGTVRVFAMQTYFERRSLPMTSSSAASLSQPT